MRVIAVVFSFFSSIVLLNGMNPTMSFRVGFEFQTSGELCKMALESYSVQKRPFLKIFDASNKELFHVVLDGPDIEFVTRAFASNDPMEENSLNECMGFIVKSTNELMKLLKDNSGKTTIKDWVRACCVKSSAYRYEICTKLFNRISNYTVEIGSSDWQMTWQPQMTIQHPLARTIGLLESLFENTSHLERIKESKPFYNPVSNGEKPLYSSAIGGLIFLLSHELLGISQSAVYQPLEILALILNGKKVGASVWIEDEDMVADTHKSFNDVHQFDAKRRTFFMSRRPFSDMLSDILQRDCESGIICDEASLQKLDEISEFSHLFKMAMQENNFFRARRDTLPEKTVMVDEGFKKANYAEQFWDGTEEASLDLTAIGKYFDEKIQKVEAFGSLLQKGILSTTMLRHMDLDRAYTDRVLSERAKNLIQFVREEGYYDEVLKSVAEPKEREFLYIASEGGKVSIMVDSERTDMAERPIISDLLSPPFPLDKDDAMGFFRESKSYQQNLFGSAIVEIRAVCDVNKFLSERNRNRPLNFFKDPLYVEEEVSKLYKGLCAWFDGSNEGSE